MKTRQQQFIDYLHTERGLSLRTRKAYQRDLSQLAEEMQRLNIEDPARVSEHTIRGLIARLHRQGQGSRSLQRLLSAVRSFYRWLMKEGFASHNPAASVRAPKAARKLPETLDADAITRLLDIADDSPLAIRDKAFIGTATCRTGRPQMGPDRFRIRSDHGSWQGEQDPDGPGGKLCFCRTSEMA